MQIVGGYQAMDKASPLAFRQALMSPYLNGHLSLPLGGQAAAVAAAAAAAAAAASGATSPGNPAMTNLRLSPTLSNRSSEESIETTSTSATTTARPKQRRSTKEANPEAVTPHDYKCPLCSEILPCQRDFTAHIRAHNEVKPQNDPNDPTGQAKVYYCCLCGKMLSSFSSLDRHMLVHSGERPFSCHLCGQTFTTNGNMHRHSRTHGTRDSHESDISSAGSCGGSKRGGGRKRKVSIENPQPMNGIESSPHVPISNITASSPSPMAMSEFLKADNSHYLNKLAGNIPPHVKCPMCSEMFYSEISMEAHINITHAGQCIDCDECKQKFPNYGYLRLHKNIYHHRSDASFPLQSLCKMQSLTSPIPHIPILPPSPLPIIPPIQKLPKVESSILSPRKDEKILDLSSPVKKYEPCFLPKEDRSPIKSKGSIAPSEADMESIYDEHEELLKDMKLKGEFPCRVCPAVYPNLRALKGHNKEHMNKAPYFCNVGECTYSSNDKSTLARHMRTHTGEKPFECTICNFGFTTKANCERHVKNKHGKNTREEVVESIIIHETDENSGMLNSSMTESNNSSFQDNGSDHLVSPPKKRKDSETTSDSKKANMFFAPYHNSMFRPAVEDTKPADVERTDDSPLDLSRPIGNLPLKVKDFSKEKLIDSTHLPVPMDLKAQEDFAKSFAAAAAAASSTSGYTGFPGQNPLPFLFSHLASAGQFDLTAYILAQQEALRRQREVEASNAATAAKDPASFLMHLSNLQSMASRAGTASFPSSGSNVSRTSNENANPHSFYHSQQHQDSQSSNIDKSDSDSDNYKMVIKNGVLMKKQKQRRYRTERPHECEHCSARFTLRSNMERHIKQQHGGEASVSSNASSIPLARHDPQLKEDEDRDENEDSDAEYQQEDDDAMHSNDNENTPNDCIPKNITDLNDADEEEEEGVDLSCLEKLVKGTKPFNTFFDNTEDEDEEVAHEEAGSEEKKMSAYSTAPNKIPCPYCGRTFPWLSSLKRHILTHTGDKPYKCHECPLWFTTKSNCDRHLVRKHGNNNNEQDVISKRHEYSNHATNKHDDASSYEGDMVDESDIDVGRNEENDSKPNKETNGSVVQTDYPFKCHLCDDGFAERELAIDHLQTSHSDEYDNLLSKGAFDTTTKPDSSSSPNSIEATGEETFDQIRGRFPDYVNRKIICLFCLRKFWSAEDLRRHVRTHTGERPYSCDICQRKFTLKHSMLRHRKKHDSGVSSGGDDVSDDTDSESVGASVSIESGSVEDRSSPEDLGKHDIRVSQAHKDMKSDSEPPTKPQSEIKKKRLMDKINKLSSAVTTTDGSITQIFEKITNGNDVK